MVITAKFSGTCNVCNCSIAIGSKVEWASGSKARHVACVTSAAPVAASRKKLSNGDRYFHAGNAKIFGCAACRTGKRMCEQCEFDD